MYLLGLDIGSSSVKVALVEAQTLQIAGVAHSPATEMIISAPQPNWAEQDPALWWEHTRLAIQQLLENTGVQGAEIAAVGIAYQMHGLVCLDKHGLPVRPAIIWCDSRAVPVGDRAAIALGADFCRQHYLNLPGNFTASKLRWVQENEPETYARIHTFLLPGDYIAYRLTGEKSTTLSGLSEGILWDFRQHTPAKALLEHYGIDPQLSPTLAPTFGVQGQISAAAARELGLPTGIPVTYRAGDQPNNALAMNVLRPGEVAATGGTSGVVYAVTDQLISDREDRVNSFAHVNHRQEQPSIGVLLCINGAGSQYNWLRQHVAPEGINYAAMERQASAIPAGADGLCMLPFGNGAERLLGNKDLGAQICGLNFNRHQRAHLYRAALEGIAFSFVLGVQALRKLGLAIDVLRVGDDNLFQSAVFSSTLSNLLGCRIEMVRSNGAVGAAIGAGYGAGVYSSLPEGLAALKTKDVFEPASTLEAEQAAYEKWLTTLQRFL